MIALIRPFANRGLSRCVRHDFTRTLYTTLPLTSFDKANSPPNETKHENKTNSPPFKDKNKPIDNIEYSVNFKTFDVKKIFKEFYSVYGPLFLVCHIGVSLVSLGFFCSLTWIIVDPTEIIPGFIQDQMATWVFNSAGTGSKFVVAYALHKVIFPFRIGTAIWATRRIATRVDFFRKRIQNIKKP